MVVSAILVPVYGQMARSPLMLLVLGPVAIGSGHLHVRQLRGRAVPGGRRATGQGTSYNAGRMAGAVAP